MSLVERKILTDAHGYREVALDYRIARAAMLDTPWGKYQDRPHRMSRSRRLAKQSSVWSICLAWHYGKGPKGLG